MIWETDLGPALDEDALIAAYQVEDRSRPHLRVNMVSSLDGAVEVGGRVNGLSSTEDGNHLRRLRMLADVLLVGAGTVRVENYGPLRLLPHRREWRLRNGFAEHPVLAIVSGSLDIDPGHRALAEAPVRPLVITRPDAPPERREALEKVADVVIAGRYDPDTEESPVVAQGIVPRRREVVARGIVQALLERGFTQILCEGGPQLWGALAAEDLVDELCLTLEPMLAGPGASRIIAGQPFDPRRLVLKQILRSDEDALLFRYLRNA